MLTKWKLFNFKAIQQETELEFKPLTIFAGANSSGKSTVLQSILLVAQSLSNEVTNRPIILNGDLVKLGQFDDLRSMNSESSAIALGWNLKPLASAPKPSTRGVFNSMLRYAMESESDVRQVSGEIVFDAKSGSDSTEVLQLQPSLVTLDMEAALETFDSGLRTSTMRVSQKPVVATDEQANTAQEFAAESRQEHSLFSVEFDATTEEERLSQNLAHFVDGPLLRNFLPDALAVYFDARVVVTETIIRALLGEQRALVSRSGFSQILDEPLPSPLTELITANLASENPFTERLKALFKGIEPVTIRSIEKITRRPRVVGHTKPDVLRDPDAFRPLLIEHFSSQGFPTRVRRRLSLPDEFRAACHLTRSWFVARVKYLGPLRDEPKAVYPLIANIDPRDVGLRGEHTAAVLHVHRKQLVDYLPAQNFLTPRVSPEKKPRTLEAAVCDWLIYLGVAAEVLTKDMGKLGHEMQVRLHDGDTPHDLTHVGVGVSQVLPIVVSCLLAEPDTLLIFEQPELHLHPKVQTLLADFFLAMAMLDKQCVLETHSEYLINRLRFRAAAAEGRQLVDTMQIYFVEKFGNQAQFRKVEVNEYGAILDWPDGFFDQSQREAEQTLKAAFAKKQEERSKR